MIPSVEERQVRPCYVFQLVRDVKTKEIVVPCNVQFLCRHCKIDISKETAICDLNGKDTGWARNETCKENITEDEYREFINFGQM